MWMGTIICGRPQHHRAFLGQGEQLVLNVDLKNKRRSIDLGGGVASYSMALLRGQSTAYLGGSGPQGAPQHR